MSHQRRASWAKYQTEEGYEYYYDEDTRNSQWERPCDYSSDQDIAAAVADPDSSNGDYGTYYPAAAEVGEVGKGVVTEGEDTTTQSYLSTNEILLEENPQQEYAEYYQDQYYGGTTYEDFYFEYDTTANLFDELARLTLFQSLPPQEISSLRSGHWCHVSCRKLEVLQMCLENYGTEEEWKAIFSYNDWIAMRYLMKFMHPSAYPVLQDAAARCLAYAHLPYPKIWSDYLHAMLKPSPLHFYRVTYIAVERMKVLVEMPPEEKPAVPYAGFDSRDVKDFNMENMEEFDLSNGEGTATKGVYEMIGATDVATTIAVWLLLLFEIYRSPSRLIGDDFRRRRIALLGMSLDTARGGAVVTTTGEGLSGEEDQQKCSMENFLEMVSDLLCLSSKFKESSYLLCLKVVAAINWQVPAKDLVGSTEIAEICAQLQFDETNPAAVNVSEGLLHLLNDIGYPNHKLPETLPTLQLCYDLITTPGYEGFFYVNDIKVMIEVIIRELSNLPWEEDSWKPLNRENVEDEELSSSSHTTGGGAVGEGELVIYDGLHGPVEGILGEALPHNELLRQMYLKLAISLMTRTSWPSLESYYKKAELDGILQWWLDNGMAACPETIELVSEVMDKKLGTI